MGHVLQCDHLAMPGLWGTERIRQSVRVKRFAGVQNTSGVLKIFGFSELYNLNIVTELANQRVRFDVNPEFLAPKPLGLFIFQILTAEFSKRLLYPRSPRACRYRQPATYDNFSPP